MNICTDIPMPADPARGRPAIYPFGRMKVGDSFLVMADRAPRARLAAAAHKRLHPGWDYMSRKEGGCVRIWRTA